MVRANVLLALAVAAAAGGPELPRDPEAVVLMLDERGGYGLALPPAPMLEVLRNGTLRSYGKKVGVLPEKEVLELVRWVVEEKRLLEHDPKKVNAKMGRKNVAIVDAATTTVRVGLKDRRHEVKEYALQWAAKNHPEVEELQRAAAVERRLRLVLQVARAGGEKKAREMLRLANEKLKKAHPKVAPLKLEHLSRAGETPNGRREFRFHRPGPGNGYTSVVILVAEEADPEIYVNVG